MNIPSHNTAAIVLAAGSSSRMKDGQHKLLLPLGNRPVLAHVLRTVQSSQARPIMLVLGREAAQVRAQIAEELEQTTTTVIENSAYQQGMSTSLHAGLTALQTATPDIDSAIVLLGDQPLMTAEIIDTLIRTRRTTGASIVAPLYQGKRGNPVLFAASLFPELLTVTGDEGGRSVIERHRQEMITIEIDAPTATIDVDTWEAYQQLLVRWQHTATH